MKINFLRLVPCVVALSLLGACSKKEETKTPIQATPSKIERNDTSSSAYVLPNYRYVDGDSLLARYNLAKDFTEQMLKEQSSMETEMKKLQENIQNQQKVMQDKQQSGVYTSQADVDADMKRLTELNNTAEEKMQSMQEQILSLSEKNQKTVTDSINKFIEEYNMTRGYDAIFFKAATLYINPELDITDEVVEALNKRYNKK